jgi:hypothetical protein
MATRSVRFGVGDPQGRRAAEWVAMWKPTKSDVYLAARVLGQTFKISLHESGECHVASGSTGSMHQPGTRPRFVETWKINPNDQVVQPFGIVVPEVELREGDWARHRDKGTRWIPVHDGSSVEIAIFLTRVHPPPRDELAAAGWHTIIVCERLPDGRDFWVIAGDGGAIPETRRIELQNMKDACRRALTSRSLSPTNPRILALATDDRGTRRYVDAAVN